MARYNVVLKTRNVDGAGTNADVAVQLRGQNGVSKWMILDHPDSDDRERGSEDVYCFPVDFWLGQPTEVAFRLRQADNDRPDWCLDYATVIDFNVAGNQAWQFPFNAWIVISGKTNWFDGPVLRNPAYLGPAPYAVYCSTGCAPAEDFGTSSSALTGHTVACRSLSGVSRSADKLDIFCGDTFGQVSTAAWEPSFSDGWHGWWPIGAMNAGQGAITSAATRSTDHLDVFCVGLDGSVYTAAWQPDFADGWHGWWNIGGPGACPGSLVKVVSRSTDRLDLFCIGMDGFVYTSAWPSDSSATWSAWRRIGGLQTVPGGGIGAVSRDIDKLDVFCVGTDGGVYTAAWEPGRGDWRGWWRIGDLQAVRGSSPVAVSRSRDKLDVLCTGADGTVYTAAWEPAFTDGWHGWWQIAGLQVTPGTPVEAVCRSADKLDIFCVGSDGFAYTAAWEPAFSDGWHGWWRVGDLRISQGSSIAAVSRAPDTLDIFCVAADGRVFTAAWEPAFVDGWHGWWPVRELHAVAPRGQQVAELQLR